MSPKDESTRGDALNFLGPGLTGYVISPQKINEWGTMHQFQRHLNLHPMFLMPSKDELASDNTSNSEICRLTCYGANPIKRQFRG
jgi:hypothetical protein